MTQKHMHTEHMQQQHMTQKHMTQKHMTQKHMHTQHSTRCHVAGAAVMPRACAPVCEKFARVSDVGFAEARPVPMYVPSKYKTSPESAHKLAFVHAYAKNGGLALTDHDLPWVLSASFSPPISRSWMRDHSSAFFGLHGEVPERPFCECAARCEDTDRQWRTKNKRHLRLF